MSLLLAALGLFLCSLLFAGSEETISDLAFLLAGALFFLWAALFFVELVL